METLDPQNSQNSSAENGYRNFSHAPSSRTTESFSVHAIRVDYSAYYVVAPILAAIVVSVVLMRVFMIDADYMGYCGGFLGFVCGIVVLFSYHLKHHRSVSIVTLLSYRTLCDVGIALRFMFNWVSNVYVCDDYICDVKELSVADENKCRVASMIMQFFQIASEGWLLCIAFDLAVTITNPFSSLEKRIKVYHYVVWGIATILTVIVGADKSIYGFWEIDDKLHTTVCWLDSDPNEEAKVNYRPIVFFYLPVICIYSYTIYVVLRAQLILFRGLPTSMLHNAYNLNISSTALTVFVCYWIFQSLAYFLADGVWKRSIQAGEVLWGALLFGMSGKAAACLVAYAAVGLFDKNLENCSSQSGSGDAEIHLFDLNKMLQQEMTGYISRGMEICAAMLVDEANINWPPKHTIVMKALDRYKVMAPQLQEMARQGPEGLLRQMGCATDAEVRREIENANSPLRLSTSARPSDSIYMTGGLDRESVTDPDPHTTAFLSPTSMADVKSLPEKLIEIIGGWLRRSSILLESSEDVGFTEYCPGVFQCIRDHFHIREAYAAAFRSDVQSRLVKGGASGSLFFKSKCERFIIKSCTRAEMKKLRAIAPALEQHFAEHPNSLITKIFGAYKLNIYACDLYFIVMNNVQCVRAGERLSEVYDLKGSSVNRYMARPKDRQRVECRHCGKTYIFYKDSASQRAHRSQLQRSFSSNPSVISEIRENRCTSMYVDHEPYEILKDNDLSGKVKLMLPLPVAREFSQMVAIDAQLLSSLNVMDYSLLVGVVKQKIPVRLADVASSAPAGLLNEHTSSVETKLADSDLDFSFATKRFQTVEAPAAVAYYTGIIDYLQDYNWRKRLEHHVKVYLGGQNKTELSCIPAADYAERFNKFIQDFIHFEDFY